MNLLEQVLTKHCGPSLSVLNNEPYQITEAFVEDVYNAMNEYALKCMQSAVAFQQKQAQAIVECPSNCDTDYILMEMEERQGKSFILWPRYNPEEIVADLNEFYNNQKS